MCPHDNAGRLQGIKRLLSNTAQNYPSYDIISYNCLWTGRLYVVLCSDLRAK